MFAIYQYFFAFMFLLITGSTLGSSVKIIRQGDEALVEVLGKYDGKKLEPGLTFLTPFFEQVAYKTTLKEQMWELPLKQYVTSDRAKVTLDILVFWKITDLERASYKVQNLREAMLNILLLQIRSEMINISSESLYTIREEFNGIMVEKLDVTTEPWGVKITRVELRDFTIGNDAQASSNNHKCSSKSMSIIEKRLV